MWEVRKCGKKKGMKGRREERTERSGGKGANKRERVVKRGGEVWGRSRGREAEREANRAKCSVSDRRESPSVDHRPALPLSRPW